MQALRPDRGPCDGRAPTLLVMLPGAYSRPAEFVDEGFVDAVRQRGLAVDITIADAHRGYFMARSVLERLHEDIVLPARREGYRRIWLLGISLGGFGALAYGARHGDTIDGIVALAPYLGTRELLQDIEGAGGPAAWLALQPPGDNGNVERDTWRWLAALATEKLPVYLGCGREDRLRDASRLLARALPDRRYDEVAGDHDWPAWRTLWSNWLDRRLLTAGCGA